LLGAASVDGSRPAAPLGRDRATPGGGLPLGVHMLAVLPGIQRLNSTLVMRHVVTDRPLPARAWRISRVLRQDRRA
jgi:hypothetical protein